MSNEPQSAFTSYSGELTRAPHPLSRKLVKLGAQTATVILAECTIQAIVGTEAIAGFAVEPIVALLGLGEEVGGGIGTAKLAGWVGRKVDEWYDRRQSQGQFTSSTQTSVAGQPEQPKFVPDPGAAKSRRLMP